MAGNCDPLCKEKILIHSFSADKRDVYVAQYIMTTRFKRVTRKPQRKEKLKEFCEWVEQEVMPVFDEYLRSWL